jgi:predicted lactoylglutathione lyase
VDWDWSRRVLDHVDVHASEWSEGSACFTNLNVLDGRPPTTALHLCFHARSRETVDAFHRAGAEAGFRSNGEPGFRDCGPGYYAAYLLDPDGNNVGALFRNGGSIGHGIGPVLR